MGAKAPSQAPIVVLIVVLIVALAWIGIQPVRAMDLYVGEAVQTAGTDDRALVSAALNQVLVRLTGRVDENLVAELQIQPAAAERLLLGRQFRNVEVPLDEDTIESQRRLRAEFDPDGVNRLLDGAGLPRWGSERPQVLLWVVVDDGESADFVVDDPVIDFTLDQAAFRYGLDLLTPLLDARDVTEVQPGDVRGGFVDAAVPAARRYRADVVVMADLRAGENFWTGRWVWRLGDADRGFERSAASRAEVLDMGIARIAGALASRFATVASDTAGQYRVEVSGIDTPVQYAEVLAYLESLSLVRRVRVEAARADTVEFELSVGASGLEDVIAMGELLTFDRHDVQTGTLHYRLAW